MGRIVARVFGDDLDAGFDEACPGCCRRRQCGRNWRRFDWVCHMCVVCKGTLTASLIPIDQPGRKQSESTRFASTPSPSITRELHPDDRGAGRIFACSGKHQLADTTTTANARG